MERIQFYLDDGYFGAFQYTHTLEQANSIAQEIGYKCEIHEEETENVGFGYSVRWNTEEALTLVSNMKSNGKLSEQYEWILPNMKFQYQLIDDRAKPPAKAHIMDSGYDVYIIDVHKHDDKTNTTYYRTGLKVRPPFGFYFEMYPRSSLSKTGYMLANSVGVIDANYRGEVLVALKKVCASAPDLDLPLKAVQLIPKAFVHMEAIETNDFDDTERNEGGFGSSGN